MHFNKNKSGYYSVMTGLPMMMMIIQEEKEGSSRAGSTLGRDGYGRPT